MTRWVLHVDLDQFIAAVEVLRRPELRGRPVVVGGDGDPTKRGVVSTASYEARAHGVHSGLPLRTAARRCPDAVFLPVDRQRYEAASAEVMAALRELGAVVEVLGWDEAFLAVDTDDPEAVAREIQRAGPRGDRPGLHRRHRPEQAAGQAGHRVRQAGRGVPAHRTRPGSRCSATGRPTRCGASAPRRPSSPSWASAPSRARRGRPGRWPRGSARRPGRGWSGWCRRGDADQGHAVRRAGDGRRRPSSRTSPTGPTSWRGAGARPAGRGRDARRRPAGPGSW